MYSQLVTSKDILSLEYDLLATIFVWQLQYTWSGGHDPSPLCSFTWLMIVQRNYNAVL